jgi:hypothetical protein
MHQVIARYKVKLDRADENLELVRAVYDELERTKPAGLRYATFLLDDGVSFVHIAQADADPNPLPQVAAFQEFQREIAERCEEQPQVSEVQEVGAYRFFDLAEATRSRDASSSSLLLRWDRSNGQLGSALRD